MLPSLFIFALALGILAAPRSVEAQQPTKVPRIGLLCAIECGGRIENLDGGRAFLEGLRGLGYTDGQNIFLDDRGAGVAHDKLPASAAELVRLKVDVILALEGVGAARAAKNATPTIPIVMVGVPDAVQFGLVRSLARPGANITGLSLPSSELVAKQLELLKDAVPGISRIAVVWNPQNAEHVPALNGVDIAARGLGLQLQPFEIRDPRDFDRAFSAISNWRAAAVLVLNDPLLYGGELTLWTIKNRLPTISLRRGFVAAGGLMSYGPNRLDLYQRAAGYLGKILKGAKPADLPVEEPTRFELVVNLTTAKALGLEIPQSILIRADQVIQ